MLKTEQKVLIFAVLAGLSMWVIDSILDVTVFFKGSFLDYLVLDVPPYEIYVRTIFGLSFVVFGFAISRVLAKRRLIEEELRRHRENLTEIVNEQTAELAKANEFLQKEIQKSKLAEESIRVSEARYRGIVEDQTELICRFLPDGTLTFVNDAYCRYFEKSREELIGHHFFPLIPEEDREMVESKIASLDRHNQTTTYEHRVVRPDGALRWQQWTDRAVFDNQGHFIEFQSVGSDVTEQREAAEALRKSEEHFRSLIENVSDIITVLDEEGTITFKSASVERVLGYRAEDLVGRNVFEFIHPEDRPLVAEAMNAIKDSPGATRSTEFRFRTRHESWRVLEAAGKTLIDETGVPKIIVNSHDITERKETEQSLKESELKFRRLSQQFNTLLGAISHPLTLLSPDLKVLWANRGTEDSSGKTALDLSGEFCYTLWHGRSAPCSDCPVIRSFHTGKTDFSQISTPDGNLWNLSAFPIRGDEGGVISVLTVANDITEKTRLQAETMRAAHLASLGELAAGVAHEINNPINGIINYAQILANRSLEQTIEHEIATKILKEGDRIAGIVKSLLSFARDRKSEKVPVNLYDVLTEALTLTRAQLLKDGIQLKVSVPFDLPQVIGHPQQLEQVFLNIINNARYALNQKYPSPDEGKSFEIIGRGESVDGRPFVLLSFQDAGVGITPGILDKVLDPFFTTKPSGIGTGLGLSISHGIITDHGGRLLIESVEGLHTRITLSLPAQERVDGKSTRR